MCMMEGLIYRVSFVRCSEAGIKPAQDMEDAPKTFRLIQTLEKYAV